MGQYLGVGDTQRDVLAAVPAIQRGNPSNRRGGLIGRVVHQRDLIVGEIDYRLLPPLGARQPWESNRSANSDGASTRDVTFDST